MKKILVLLFVGICSVTLIAGPHGRHGGHHHGGYRGYDRGLWTARQVVGIVADGVRIANGLGYGCPAYYAPPAYYQPTPVYVQPQVQYVYPQQQVVYQQPQTVVVQPQPQTVVVQQPTVNQEVIYVRPRREFIVTRILRAVLE